MSIQVLDVRWPFNLRWGSVDLPRKLRRFVWSDLRNQSRHSPLSFLKVSDLISFYLLTDTCCHLRSIRCFALMFDFLIKDMCFVVGYIGHTSFIAYVVCYTRFDSHCNASACGEHFDSFPQFELWAHSMRVRASRARIDIVFCVNKNTRWYQRRFITYW